MISIIKLLWELENHVGNASMILDPADNTKADIVLPTGVPFILAELTVTDDSTVTFLRLVPLVGG